MNISVITLIEFNKTSKYKKKKKKTKQTGKDEMSGKILKAANDNTLLHLLSLFNEIWIKELPPQE